MPLRFFRRIHLLRGLTLNLSKGGVSVSGGFPGFHVTSGTTGSRVTFGIPGTGLFYTHHLTAAVPPDAKARAISAYAAGLYACASNPAATPPEYAQALNRLADYGLSDADLPSDLRSMVIAARGYLRDAHGYRIVPRTAPVRDVTPRRPLLSRGLTIAIVIALIVWACFTVYFFMEPGALR